MTMILERADTYLFTAEALAGDLDLFNQLLDSVAGGQAFHGPADGALFDPGSTLAAHQFFANITLMGAYRQLPANRAFEIRSGTFRFHGFGARDTSVCFGFDHMILFTFQCM